MSRVVVTSVTSSRLRRMQREFSQCEASEINSLDSYQHGLTLNLSHQIAVSGSDQARACSFQVPENVAAEGGATLQHS